MLLRLVESVGNGRFRALRLPLLCAGRAFRQLPFVFEQVLEKEIAPFGRRLRPGDFGPAGDGVGANALAMFALPTEALRFERSAFRLGADQRRIARTVRLAKTVATGN